MSQRPLPTQSTTPNSLPQPPQLLFPSKIPGCVPAWFPLFGSFFNPGSSVWGLYWQSVFSSGYSRMHWQGALYCSSTVKALTTADYASCCHLLYTPICHLFFSARLICLFSLSSLFPPVCLLRLCYLFVSVISS